MKRYLFSVSLPAERSASASILVLLRLIKPRNVDRERGAVDLLPVFRWYLQNASTMRLKTRNNRFRRRNKEKCQTYPSAKTQSDWPKDKAASGSHYADSFFVKQNKLEKNIIFHLFSWIIQRKKNINDLDRVGWRCDAISSYRGMSGSWLLIFLYIDSKLGVKKLDFSIGYGKLIVFVMFRSQPSR